jgi:hypothetical protein
LEARSGGCLAATGVLFADFQQDGLHSFIGELERMHLLPALLPFEANLAGFFGGNGFTLFGS